MPPVSPEMRPAQKAIAEIVSALIHKLGASETSRMLGISRSGLYHILEGRRRPGMALLGGMLSHDLLIPDVDSRIDDYLIEYAGSRQD